MKTINDGAPARAGVLVACAPAGAVNSTALAVAASAAQSARPGKVLTRFSRS
jgi:hypothetical protein